MSVSARDKEYMQRLAEFEAEARTERGAAHLALSLLERVRRSLTLSRKFRARANLSQRLDDPMPFYDRAKRLGLYQP